MLARILTLAGLAALAGCGSPQSPQESLRPGPLRLIPPALSGTPGATLSGTVFVARDATLDTATGLPAGYRPLPGSGRVTAWAATCAEPCLERHGAEIAGGQYRLPGLPLGIPLVIEATAPGATARRITTVLWGDAILDFAADAERVTGTYLRDAPEVVAVEPAPGGDLDPAAATRFRVRFSEAIDPGSVASATLALSSPDLPGMRVTGGTPFFEKAATVEPDGPDAAILTVPGPLPTRPGGARLELAFGKGQIREAPAGRLVRVGATGTVSGAAWAAGAAAVPFRLQPDATAPRVVSVRVDGFEARGVRLVMTWSEPMAVMWADGWPQGKPGRQVLDPGAYQILAEDGASAAAGIILDDVAFHPADPRIVTALATGSFRPYDGLVLVPRDVADPAGNPAVGSVRLN